MDLKSPEQQMIRSTGINEMESSGYSHGPDNQVEVDVAESEGRVASKT